MGDNPAQIPIAYGYLPGDTALAPLAGEKVQSVIGCVAIYAGVGRWEVTLPQPWPEGTFVFCGNPHTARIPAVSVGCNESSSTVKLVNVADETEFVEEIGVSFQIFGLPQVK